MNKPLLVPEFVILVMSVVFLSIGCASTLSIQPHVANSVGMTLVYISPGDFFMGSPESENVPARDEERHCVRLTKGFYLAATEVTQSQWKAIMGENNNPSEIKGDNHPVTKITWDMAVEFCKLLSIKEKRNYRLPAEAEWEYACRAGREEPISGTGKMNDMGWFRGNSNSTTHPVKEKSSNDWGLYDMHGNVWEWCQDWYGQYPISTTPAVNPQGPTAGIEHSMRGGSFNHPSLHCRSACRSKEEPGYFSFVLGFRVALDLDLENAGEHSP